ncbi:hypothetical protein K443DRAFT_673244 [Laccaria amethystina LaAM-08-1]|uniref:Uncharacterized protein n=1 Tax=Laccaria amethystina LaAM-08-1 TaxID=1095629 RepID=A0A0C9Y186_9AGAR|nr:hypothetical protein K443DRAFT_673244 [Laccaria amethystina LaAM-08-1]
MTRPAPRLQRLPHRLDYTLIPAPLDLSLPLATEKSPLPAIIVTPSSPSSTRDFSIAFLAPPQKPSIKDRFLSTLPFQSTSSSSSIQFKARSTIIILLLLFILLCHVATHRFASRNRPHLDFAVQAGTPAHVVGAPKGWFDFRALFGEDGPGEQVPRDFIVTEAGAR